MEQVFSLPIEIIFQYAYDFSKGVNLTSVLMDENTEELLILRNSTLPKEEFRVDQLKQLSMHYFFESINFQRSTRKDIRWSLIQSLKHNLGYLIALAREHIKLFNHSSISSLTKMGILFLISGELQNHITAVEKFLKKYLNYVRSDICWNNTYFTFSICSFLIKSRELILRSMKYIEKVCLLPQRLQSSKLFQVQSSAVSLPCPSLRYCLDQYAFSKEFKLASIYEIPLSSIRILISLHPDWTNLNSSFVDFLRSLHGLSNFNSILKLNEHISEVYTTYFQEISNFEKEFVEFTAGKVAQVAELQIYRSNSVIQRGVIVKVLKPDLGKPNRKTVHTLQPKSNSIPSRRPFSPLLLKNNNTSTTTKGTVQSLKVQMKAVNDMSLHEKNSENSIESSRKLKRFLFFNYLPIYWFVASIAPHHLSFLYEKIKEIYRRNFFFKLAHQSGSAQTTTFSSVFEKQLQLYLSYFLLFAVYGILEQLQKEKNRYRLDPFARRNTGNWKPPVTDRSSFPSCKLFAKKSISSMELFEEIARFEMTNYELLKSSALDQDFHQKRITNFLDIVEEKCLKEEKNWKNACTLIGFDYEVFIRSFPDYLLQRERKANATK